MALTALPGTSDMWPEDPRERQEEPRWKENPIVPSLDVSVTLIQKGSKVQAVPAGLQEKGPVAPGETLLG